MITMPPHEETLLFSSTATYSKMHLSDSPKARTLPLYTTDKNKAERPALACRSTSKELQQRLLIVSDTSDPGLDDPFASSASDSSSEDHDDDSEGEALEQAAAHLWDSWWSPARQNLEMRQSFYQVTPRSTVNIMPEPLSPYNRNFATENLSDLTLSNEPLSKLHRSSAIRNAKHQSRSQTPPSTRQSQHAYTTFPPQPPPVPPKPQNYRPHGRYKSWPTRSSSRQMSRPPLQRTRANTTPGNPYAPVHASGLSITTTLSPTPQGSRQTSSSTTSEDRLYMRSSLNTPPTRPLMDLMSSEICLEISCFEDDDDDDEKLGLIDSLGSKLHIRTSCGGAARDTEFDGDEKKRSSKIRSRARSATLAIRDVFVRKRAGTIGCS
jgi:hypothetical protein